VELAWLGRGIPVLVLSLSLSLLLASAGVAAAQEVEGPVRLALTLKLAIPTATGQRIVSVRATTRDYLELVAEDFGLVPRRATLVQRREILDLEGGTSTVWAIFDGVPFEITDDFGVETELPPEFVGSVLGFRLNRHGVEASFTEEGTGGLALSDPADAFVGALLGLVRTDGRLLTVHGMDLGYLLRSKLTLQGVARIDDPEFPDPILVTGTVALGPERLR
jgi:hypothetical protein